MPIPDPYGLDMLWTRGDLVARATLLILATMSVLSWTLLLIKVVDQFRLLHHVSEARRAFETAETLDSMAASLPPGNPLTVLTLAAMEADRRHQGAHLRDVDRHTWLTLSLQRQLGRILSPTQEGLTVLATVGATAPFIGLFGTVWSIRNALSLLGLSGQAAIDKVAGPVGESLTMTAIGLVVAVPAVLAYNLLNRRNRVIAERIRAFATDVQTGLLGGFERKAELKAPESPRALLSARMA